MTGYSKIDISYAVELIHQISELSPGEVEISEALFEVAAWVETAIQCGQAQALTNFVSQCGPAGTATYLRAMELIRDIGSRFEYSGRQRILFGIPLSINADIKGSLPMLECRQVLEREFESAKGIPFLSVRMCDHPTRRVELDLLGPLELARIGKDIVRYSSSKKLAPPILGHGPDNLIWLGVFEVHSEGVNPLFKQVKGPELQPWRNLARDLIQKELVNLNPTYVDTMFPMPLQNALSASRISQLRAELHQGRVATGADKLTYKKSYANLTWTLLNTETGEDARGESWLPDETLSLVTGSLTSFAKKHQLALVQAAN